MKTQILSKRNAPLGIIGFLLLVTTTLLGCGVLFNVNRVIGLEPVILTQDDLHMMGLTESNRIHIRTDDLPVMRGTLSNRSGFSKKSPVIVGFEQREVGGTVQYWLFDSASTAKKAGAEGWIWIPFAEMPNFHPEFDPDDVIGDATWRDIRRNRSEWENGLTGLWFVKCNLLISVRTDEHLQDARDVARKIEAKIEAVLLKK